MERETHQGAALLMQDHPTQDRPSRLPRLRLASPTCERYELLVGGELRELRVERLAAAFYSLQPGSLTILDDAHPQSWSGFSRPRNADDIVEGLNRAMARDARIRLVGSRIGAAQIESSIRAIEASGLHCRLDLLRSGVDFVETVMIGDAGTRCFLLHEDGHRARLTEGPWLEHTFASFSEAMSDPRYLWQPGPLRPESPHLFTAAKSCLKDLSRHFSAAYPGPSDRLSRKLAALAWPGSKEGQIKALQTLRSLLREFSSRPGIVFGERMKNLEVALADEAVSRFGPSALCLAPSPEQVFDTPSPESTSSVTGSPDTGPSADDFRSSSSGEVPPLDERRYHEVSWRYDDNGQAFCTGVMATPREAARLRELLVGAFGDRVSEIAVFEPRVIPQSIAEAIDEILTAHGIPLEGDDEVAPIDRQSRDLLLAFAAAAEQGVALDEANEANEADEADETLSRPDEPQP